MSAKVSRARALTRSGSSALLVGAIMFIGSLGMWLGVPLAWLWIGSQVQGATRSVGVAIMTMIVGVLVSVIGFATLLAWLSHKHSELRAARGLPAGGQPLLEAVLVVSAGLAVVIFGAWFFLFSGSAPWPGAAPIND